VRLPRLYLKQIAVVPEVQPTGAFDDDGRQDAEVLGAPPVFTGALQPISVRERSLMQQGSVGPVPSFVAWLPIDAPVGAMDYHLEVDGLNYYPWQDAQDMGGAGQFWRVQLGSPGQRRA